MGIHTKTCIQMLTVPLFTIANRQKQLKYPSTDEQNGQAIKYYPAMKRNPILTHAMTWINLEILMPFERRQVQNTCIVWSHLYKVKNRQNQTFPAVQWLKLCSSNAGDMGLTPSWGTIPSAQPKKRKKKQRPSHGDSKLLLLRAEQNWDKKMKGFLLGMTLMFQNWLWWCFSSSVDILKITELYTF